MINKNLYVNVVSMIPFVNFVIYTSTICIMINYVISFTKTLQNFKKGTNSEQISKEKTYSIIDMTGGIFIAIAFLTLMFQLMKIWKFISLMYFPSIILLFYTIYIKPMTYKSSTFKFDYYEYGSIVTFSLIFFTKINYSELFNAFNSEGMLQGICIICLLLEVYTCFYCLMLNIYFLIKNLQKININRFIKKHKTVIKKFYDIFDFDNLILKLVNTNNLIFNKDVKKSKKIVLFFPNFIIDVISCFFKYTFFFFFSMTCKPFFTILDLIFSKVMRLSEVNENFANYGLSKLVWTFSIIIVYIILQINDIFQPKIINIYEFISSVIIIPIILEALISIKEKFNKE